MFVSPNRRQGYIQHVCVELRDALPAGRGRCLWFRAQPQCPPGARGDTCNIVAVAFTHAFSKQRLSMCMRTPEPGEVSNLKCVQIAQHPKV